MKPPYSPEDYDHLEGLTSRFSRVIDILIQRVYRTIMKIELETSVQTMLDVLNAAHKRKLFTDVQQMRKMKELRNQIFHEYSKKNIE